MWISARTATTLATSALVLVLVAMAAPLMPKPHLPTLPEERSAARHGSKFGAATAILEAPERIRVQRMEADVNAAQGGACLNGRAGTGPARTPSDESVNRLLALLRDARTVADPRAAAATPTWVVRFVRDGRKVDVMVDPKSDRLALALDGQTVGTFTTPALHREFASLGDALRS